MIPRWKLTVDIKDTEIVPGRTLTEWVVTGDGAPPKLQVFGPPDVPPPPLPPPPPPPPPVGDRLAPQPGEDTTLYIYPQGGPLREATPDERQFHLGATSTTVPDCHWQTNESGAGNPSIHSLRWAGYCWPGARTPYGKAVDGFNLWVPMVRFQDGITGEWVEVAAPHLIRRARANGRLTAP